MYDKIVAIISQESENVPLQEHVMAVVIAVSRCRFVFILFNSFINMHYEHPRTCPEMKTIITLRAKLRRSVL